MEKILYFDCFAGISGDMSVGALIDLGVPFEFVESELKKLKIDGYKLSCEKRLKKGISGSKFSVKIDEDEIKEEKCNNEIKVNNHVHTHLNNHCHKPHHQHHHHGEYNHVHSHINEAVEEDKKHHVHRNINDINTIIENSELNEKVKEMAKKIFGIVAEAEAKIHGKSIEEVHFHEVGAIDSIVDITAFAICMDYLKPDIVYSSRVNLGRGFVKCAHGVIPVPAPATLEILKGVKVYSGGIEGETVTPTGAAIIKAVSQEYTDFPEMEIENTGYGAGDSEFEIPNMVRVIVGKKKV